MKLLKLLCLISVLSVAAYSAPALADGPAALAQAPDSLQLLNNVGTKAKYNTSGGTNQIATTVGNIIAYSLGLLGVIFLAFTVYAGFLYLTAGGNEDQVKQAITYVRNALIGLIIVLSSYGITKWVVNSVVNSAVTAPSSPLTPGYP